jgi:serine/threonine protein kinase
MLFKSKFDTNYEVDDAGTAKVLKVLALDKLAYISMFQQQAEVLEKLNHPGIPKVDPDGYFTFFRRGNQESLHSLVREKIAGETLQQWLDKQGRLVD